MIRLRNSPLIILWIVLASCSTISEHWGFEAVSSRDSSIALEQSTSPASPLAITEAPLTKSTNTVLTVPQPTDTKKPTVIAKLYTEASATETLTLPSPPTETPYDIPTKSVTITVTATPLVPRANPEELILPPPNVTLDQHLILGKPVGNGGNNWPVSLYRYGMTWEGRLIPHHGVDMANETGVPIVAVGDATVDHAGNDQEKMFAFRNDFYGNLIVLRMKDKWHGSTIYVLYGHLDKIGVNVGQEVSNGEVLGTIGGTGAAYAPHLHLEIRVNDPTSYWSVRNPELWYRLNDASGVLAGRILDHQGRFIPGQRVILTCRDGSQRHVYTYWDQGTPPDDVMFENFSVSGLPEGNCSVETSIKDQILQGQVEIITRQISFVVLQEPSNDG